MYFDRFDITEAYYMYYVQNHGGQYTHEYERLSRILERWEPRPLLRSEDDLSDNGRVIYDNLVQENICVYG